MGIVSHILITSMRKPLLSHKVVIGSMLAIGSLSYIVWGHHMFISGMNPFSSLVFFFPTLVITISGTILTLIWFGSPFGSRLPISTASLFSLRVISKFLT